MVAILAMSYTNGGVLHEVNGYTLHHRLVTMGYSVHLSNPSGGGECQVLESFDYPHPIDTNDCYPTQRAAYLAAYKYLQEVSKK